jgi:hypothetical protein
VSAWRLPRRMPDPRVQVPGWVRVFDAEAWRDDQADAPYLAGLLEHGLDERYRSARDWHAANRHCQATNAWYRQHPEADHRLEDMRARLARRRAQWQPPTAPR